MDAARRPLVRIAGVIGRTEQAVREARHGASRSATMPGCSASPPSRAPARTRSSRIAERSPKRSRSSASICSRRSAASCCRSRSGGASARSTMSSPSRSRRSTATDPRRRARPRRRRGRGRVTLYTGNDDHIVLDLLTPFAVRRGEAEVIVRDQRRAARPLERLDRSARSSCSSASMPRSEPAQRRRGC